MIAGLLAPAMILVDACAHKPVCQFGRKQRVINAKAVVALPGTGLIVPEGPDPAAGVEQVERIGPAIVEQARIGVARLGCISASLAIAAGDQTSLSCGTTL